MKRNLIYIIGVVCMMTSCVEENFRQEEHHQGEEVLFSASLKGAVTRTLYDESEIATSTGSVKVNWVHEDLISIYGAHCTAVKQAEYKVGTVNVDENNSPILNDDGTETPVSGRNYANYLKKTGSAGVQWGTATTSDFYAVYPSTSNSFEPINGSADNGVSVKSSIHTAQTNKFTYNTSRKCWVGVPYNGNLDNPTMNNALMYAYTSGAKPTDEIVDLNFRPFVTVLKFKFAGISFSTDNTDPVTITKITLNAPNSAKIAGDFTLNLTKNTSGDVVPSIGLSDNVSSSISIYPNYLALDSEQSVEFCVYTIPQKYTMDAEENLWSVTIESSRGTFTYMMRPSKVEGKDQTYEMLAGQIHNVNIPVKTVTDPTPLNPENWMEQIPRNVYLTELSVPGSWYSLNEGYQGSGISLDALHTAGVRAFHFDCRLTMPTADDYTGTSDQISELKLTVAGSETGGNLGSADYSYGTELETALDKVSELTKSKPKEFTVVVLTIAEKALTRTTHTYGTVDPSLVLPRIYSLLEKNKDNWNIYYKKTDEDGNIKYGIDANTLVYDVLGQMVVKINVNTSESNFSNYISDYQTHVALLSEGSMATEESTNITIGNFAEMNDPYMYWGNVKVGTSDVDTANPTMKYYYHQGQLTTDDINEFNMEPITTGPTFTQRKAAINEIVSKSKQIYESGIHNAWFQIAIGGSVKYYYKPIAIDYSSEVHGCVAEVLNKYLLDQIASKLSNKEPSPLGIVLMNYCTVDKITEEYRKGYGFSSSKEHEYITYGPELVNAILELNTLFYLNRNHNMPEWPEEDNASIIQTAYASVSAE